MFLFAAFGRRARRFLPLLLTAALLAAPASAAPDEASELRAAALALVNADRRENGLEPLRLDATLSAAAGRHAEDMLARGYFAHESPEGRTVMDRYRAAGGNPMLAVGENIANCTGCGPPRPAVLKMFETGWMNSPGHRANILNPGFDRFGYGIAAGPDGRVYAVQTFAGPGAPRGTEPGRAPRPLDPDERMRLALDLVNAARREADLETLAPAPALSTAARTLLGGQSGQGLAGLDGLAAGNLFETLPQGERGRWRSISVVAGECGGCGTKPTDSDVRFFIEQWLGNPAYRKTLLDPAMTHMGFAMTANGEGRKLAVAMVGRRR